jgi:hypothetical protein
VVAVQATVEVMRIATRLGSSRQALDHPEQLVAFVAVTTGQPDEIAGHGCHDRPGRCGARDGDTPTSAEVEETFVAQTPQGPKNRVGVDPEDSGQIACRRESFTRSALPLGDSPADLPRNLLVEIGRLFRVYLDSIHSAVYSSTMVFTGSPSRPGCPPGPDIKPGVDIEDVDGAVEAARALIEEARRRHRRRLKVTGIGILVLVLLAGLLVAVLHRDAAGPPSRRGQPPTQAGLFSRPTGDVLVFADGLGLDLDRRVANRQPIAGQRAGDQRWDIVRAGNAVVVGWGGVWATTIATGSSRLLGNVVTFVPAAEPNAVWLVDYPGGRIGEGTPTVRGATTGGTTLRTATGRLLSEGIPTVGIPGGLAFETKAGIALWNATTDRFDRRLGKRAGFIGDEADNALAWCQENCDVLHVTDVAATSRGSDRAFGSPQAGWSFVPEAMDVSPSGRDVAVMTTEPGLEAADQKGTLNVLDRRTGRFNVVRRDLSAFSTLAWSPDGRTLFFASDNGLGQSETRPGTGMTLGLYQPFTGRTETAQLRITNAEPFVVLPRSQAGAFLAKIHRPGRVCGSEAITPGVPSPPCGVIRF